MIKEEKVFTNAKDASDYLYGVDDGQVHVEIEYDQIRVTFERLSK